MNFAFGNGNIQIFNPEGGSCMKRVKAVLEAEKFDKRLTKIKARRKIRIFLVLLAAAIFLIFLFLLVYPIIKDGIEVLFTKPIEYNYFLLYCFLLLLIVSVFIAGFVISRKEKECSSLEATLSFLYEKVRDPNTECFDKKETLEFLQGKYYEIKRACRF